MPSKISIYQRLLRDADGYTVAALKHAVVVRAAADVARESVDIHKIAPKTKIEIENKRVYARKRENERVLIAETKNAVDTRPAGWYKNRARPLYFKRRAVICQSIYHI